MKRIIVAVLAIATLASCNESGNQEPVYNSTQNTAIMEKQEKQGIETLLREYEKSLNTSDGTLAQSLYQ
ncbi:MAG: lipoprotein [Saprospiraceae bacterium]|nr:lipoprotein [Saprospiraceae bacterium]